MCCAKWVARRGGEGEDRKAFSQIDKVQDESEKTDVEGKRNWMMGWMWRSEPLKVSVSY